MIENHPLVSVIVPCYNHERYIEECILSIVDQTYKNIEIVVIDDGSKDDSFKILKKLAESYNFYCETQPNQGVSKTLNKCLSYTKSHLVVTISSDDILMPNAINDFVLKYIEMYGNFSLIFGDSLVIDDESKIVKIDKSRNIAKENDTFAFSTFLDFFKYHRRELLNSRYIGTYSSFLIGNYISVGMMYNKNILTDVGAWNEDLKLEDHELWLRLSKVQKFEYTNTIVSKYRFHANNSLYQHKKYLIENAIKMLMGEKKFIKQYNTQKEWNIAYNDNLLYFLKNRKFTLFLKYYRFDSCFLYHLIVKVLKKSLRLS